MNKILVVDDDPDILDAVQMVLATGGYIAETVSKSDEVIKKAYEHMPDLIILDVLLSGADGRVICKALKGDKKTSHIPIIMFSAHPTAKDTVKEYGANGFIAKPFSVKELLDEVRRLIKRRGKS